MKLLNTVMYIVSTVCLLALVIAGAAQYINPNSGWMFAIVALGTPVIVIVNLALLIYWIIAWKKMAIVMAVFLVIFSGQISRHIRFKVKKDKEYEKCDLRVMTYNVGIFNQWGNSGKNSCDSILSVINRESPAILCLQEMRTMPARNLNYINNSLAKLPNRYVHYVTESKVPDSGGIGLAIYSKYKLINTRAVQFDDSWNSYLRADMVNGKDTLRIFNLHLQISSVKSEEVYALNKPEDTEVARSIVRKLRHNNSRRADQADIIAEEIRQSPYHVLVCGDFNDTPSSYTYRTIRDGLKDAFVARGAGLGYTYNPVIHILRIDNVFIDTDRFSILSYRSDPYPYSDHNPIVVDLNYAQL